VDTNGQVSKERREFATTYPSLLALADWLVEQHCPVVAMESTGVFWKPVYHVLAGVVEVFIGNAPFRFVFWEALIASDREHREPGDYAASGISLPAMPVKPAMAGLLRV